MNMLAVGTGCPPASPTAVPAVTYLGQEAQRRGLLGLHWEASLPPFPRETEPGASPPLQAFVIPARKAAGGSGVCAECLYPVSSLGSKVADASSAHLKKEAPRPQQPSRAKIVVSQEVPEKYKGYEELLDSHTDKDPDFIEPVGESILRS